MNDQKVRMDLDDFSNMSTNKKTHLYQDDNKVSKNFKDTLRKLKLFKISDERAKLLKKPRDKKSKLKEESAVLTSNFLSAYSKSNLSNPFLNPQGRKVRQLGSEKENLKDEIVLKENKDLSSVGSYFFDQFSNDSISTRNTLSTSSFDLSVYHKNLNNFEKDARRAERSCISAVNLTLGGTVLPGELRGEVFINLIEDDIEDRERTEKIKNKKNTQNTFPLLSEENLILENIHNSPPYCLRQHVSNKISEKMRAVLVDWLIEVHQKFGLKLNTLFLAVRLVDKMLLINKEAAPESLQLLGVSCLLLSCKYEEITCPSVSDLEYLTDNSCSSSSIRATEKEILTCLGYNITFPTVIEFYDIISLHFNFTKEDYNLGLLFAHIFLLDTRFERYTTYSVALALNYLVMKLNKEKYKNYNLVKKMIPNTEKEMKDCAKDILYLVSNFDNSIFDTVRKIFKSEKYDKVALAETLKVLARA